jgi:hypothetical protein
MFFLAMKQISSSSIPQLPSIFFSYKSDDTPNLILMEPTKVMIN